MLYRFGVRDVSVMIEEMQDQSHKLGAGTRDMMVSAFADMTRRSRGVRLVTFGQDNQNVVQLLSIAQKLNDFKVVPQYDIRGSITQFDEDIVRRQGGLGVALPLFGGVRVNADRQSSVLGFDASVVTTSDLSLVPVSVSGGLRFSAVDAGWRYHTCGLTTSGAAYCWGFNVWGQLGNGSTENTAVPAAVSGGLTFVGLSAGGTNSCGVTSPGFVYCWGDHLGKASAVPARVDGQQ